MPTILFHLKVANEYVKKHKECDTPNFYLGIIAPDAVNAYGFASKEKRWAAHKRAADLDEWKQNVINFYNENYGKVKNDYLKGYCIHILTDICSDKCLKESLYKEIIEKYGGTQEEAFSKFCSQIEIYENSKLNEEWLKEVVEKIEKAELIPINTITEDMLVKWKEYNRNKYNARNYEEAQFITDEYALKIAKLIDGVI